jgi:hypothetical protein
MLREQPSVNLHKPPAELPVQMTTKPLSVFATPGRNRYRPRHFAPVLVASLILAVVGRAGPRRVKRHGVVEVCHHHMSGMACRHPRRAAVAWPVPTGGVGSIRCHRWRSVRDPHYQSLSPSPPRCQYCGEVIAVYKPLVLVRESRSRRRHTCSRPSRRATTAHATCIPPGATASRRRRSHAGSVLLRLDVVPITGSGGAPGR